jgi:hypothetical protein
MLTGTYRRHRPDSSLRAEFTGAGPWGPVVQAVLGDLQSQLMPVALIGIVMACVPNQSVQLKV